MFVREGINKKKEDELRINGLNMENQEIECIHTRMSTWQEVIQVEYSVMMGNIVEHMFIWYERLEKGRTKIG